FTRVLPGGFEVVFDGVGEDDYRRSFQALKRGGLLCAYGYTARVQAQSRRLSLLMRFLRVYLEGVAELVAWRQAHPRLLHQCDAGATSRMVRRGPEAAF